MAENLAEYIIKMVFDSSGTVQFDKSVKTMETRLKSLGVVQKDATLESFKHTKVMKDGVHVADKISTSVKGVNGNLTKQSAIIDTATKKTMQNNTSVSAMNKNQLSLGQNLARVATRAAQTVLVWTALRMGMQKTSQAIKLVVSTLLELEKGMRKVMAVATYTEKNQSKVYSDLSKAARSYFLSSSKGFKEITEAMYQLGTAGRSTEEMLEGFEHILDLSTATFGNVAQSGKIVSGMLNVFEKQLLKVGDTSSQIQYVSDLLTTAWQNNQVELSEMATAMSYLGSVGGALNIDLKDLVAASSVMSDAMLRGGKGGRLLATALIKVAKSSDKLKDLGVLFDPREPLDFKDVMGQIHEMYEKQGSSLSFVKDLTEVFGIRGGRAVLNLVQMWGKFNEEISRTPEEIKGAAAELAKLNELTLKIQTGKLFKKVFEQITSGFDITAITKGLSIVNDYMDSGRESTDKFKKSMDEFGVSLVKSKEQALILFATLKHLKAPELAGAFREEYEKLTGTSFTPMEVITATPSTKMLDEFLNQIDKIKSKIQNTKWAEAYGKATKEIKNTNEELEKKGKLLDKDVQTAEKIVNAFVKAGQTYLSMSREEIKHVAKLLGLEHETIAVKQRTIKLRMEALKVEKDGIDGLGKAEEARLTKIREAYDLDIMRLNGAKESVVLEKQLQFLLSKELKSREKENLAIKASTAEVKKKLRIIFDISKIIVGDAKELKRARLDEKDTKKVLTDVLKLKKEIHKETVGLNKVELGRLEIAKTVDIAKASEKLTTQELIQLEYQLITASEGLYTAKEKQTKQLELQKQYEIESIKRIQEYSNILEDTFSQGLSDVIMGDTTIAEFGDKLKETISRAFADAASKRATEAIFDFTGLGDAFGKFGISIEDAFKKPEERMRDALPAGAIMAAPILSNAMVNGAKMAASDLRSATSPEDAKAGFSIPGLSALSDFLKKSRGKEGGAFGSGSITGRATGAMQLADLYKLKGTGNVFGGAAQGAMAGGMMGGPVGAVLGGLYGLFRGGQSKTTSETRTQTMRITSEIQHTNKSLSYVNRNLIALKASFDTFVLPESAFFSTKKGTIEDEFSLNQRR